MSDGDAVFEFFDDFEDGNLNKGTIRLGGAHPQTLIKASIALMRLELHID